MEELDKKLDDILDSFGPQDDRYGVYTEEVREKIKQAFEEAGWSPTRKIPSSLRGRTTDELHNISIDIFINGLRASRLEK